MMRNCLSVGLCSLFAASTLASPSVYAACARFNFVPLRSEVPGPVFIISLPNRVDPLGAAAPVLSLRRSFLPQVDRELGSYNPLKHYTHDDVPRFDIRAWTGSSDTPGDHFYPERRTIVIRNHHISTHIRHGESYIGPRRHHSLEYKAESPVAIAELVSELAEHLASFSSVPTRMRKYLVLSEGRSHLLAQAREILARSKESEEVLIHGKWKTLARSKPFDWHEEEYASAMAKKFDKFLIDQSMSQIQKKLLIKKELRGQRLKFFASEEGNLLLRATAERLEKLLNGMEINGAKEKMVRARVIKELEKYVKPWDKRKPKMEKKIRRLSSNKATWELGEDAEEPKTNAEVDVEDNDEWTNEDLYLEELDLLLNQEEMASLTDLVSDLDLDAPETWVEVDEKPLQLEKIERLSERERVMNMAHQYDGL